MGSTPTPSANLIEDGMSDKNDLIDRMAKAMTDVGHGEPWEDARTALAAIEASGTHAVVPVEPSASMSDAPYDRLHTAFSEEHGPGERY